MRIQKKLSPESLPDTHFLNSNQAQICVTLMLFRCIDHLDQTRQYINFLPELYFHNLYRGYSSFCAM